MAGIRGHRFFSLSTRAERDRPDWVLIELKRIRFVEARVKRKDGVAPPPPPPEEPPPLLLELELGESEEVARTAAR